MLSAVSPMNMPAVLQNVRTILKVSIQPDGHKVCFCADFICLTFSIVFYNFPAKWLCTFSRLCPWGLCSGKSSESSADWFARSLKFVLNT